MNTLINLGSSLQIPLGGIKLPDSPWVTIALIGLAAIILVVSGIKNKAPLGIALVAALIFIAARLGLTGLAQMGFVLSDNLLKTALLGVSIGTVLSLLSIIVIQPLIEAITKQPHDVTIIEGVQGSWKGLLSWLVLNWTFVAFGEEILFRGFLMSQLIKLLGTSFLALMFNVFLASIIFGLAHSYQGRSGIWSTGIIGVCLGVAYIMSGFNLWLPILVHGVMNSVELILMSRGADKGLRELIWKKPLQPAG